MATTSSRKSLYNQTPGTNEQGAQKNGDTVKKDLWSSMLDSVASGKRLPEKNLLVLGGSPDSQKEFLEALSAETIAKRGQDRYGSKQPPVANNFALGYTYYDVPDADHEGEHQ
jgi:dynein light intermediate chain 1